MSESDFEREATQLLRGMGLHLDADTLNFFQSDNLLSGDDKWKDGLRKPSPPRLRRVRTGEKRSVPRNEVDGQAVRKHSAPANGTYSVSKTADVSRRSPSAGSKHHVTKSEKAYSHHHHDHHHHHHHQHDHKSRSAPAGDKHPHVLHATPNKRKTSFPGQYSTAHAASSASAQTTSQPAHHQESSAPSNVKPTVPPPSLIPKPTASTRAATRSNGTVPPGSKPPAAAPGTKVIYHRKPSLKLLSVTTSSSSMVHSVADRSTSEQSISEGSVVRNGVYKSPSSTSSLNPTSPSSGKSQWKYPSPEGLNQAYDRLENYQQMLSPETATSDQTAGSNHWTGTSASPARPASVSSDASQGSTASLKSTGSGGEYQARSSSIPRQRRWSTPASISSSGSMSRSPTPVAWERPVKKSASNSSGEFYYATTDDSSQASSPLGRFSPAGHAMVTAKEGGEWRVSLNHRTTSASPEPEIRTMSALATTTVQALSTLIEVVTPATSMENLDEQVPSAGGAASSSPKASHSSTNSSSERVRSAPPSHPPPSGANTSTPSGTAINLRTSSSEPPPPVPNDSISIQPPSPVSNSSGSDHPLSLPVAETWNSLQRRAQSTKLRSASVNVEDEEEFFGYCHRCGKAVVGIDSGCLALGKVFHTSCFSCSACSKPLSGRTFYTVGNEILCEVDYLNKLSRCCFCNQRIKDRVLSAFGQTYHPGCFRCSVCGLCLDGVPYAGDSQDRVYCIQDYHKLFAPSCASCGKPIIPQPGKAKNIRVIAKDKYYHVKCYKCEGCGKLLASAILMGSNKEKCYPIDGHLFCNKCHLDHTEGNVRTTVL